MTGARASEGGLPFVSVIVPVYNDVARLKLLLSALQAQDYAGGFEVLVVDNASTEDVQSVVRDRGPPFVALFEAQPGSYAARNRALDIAKGDIVAFTDGDCIPAPDWLERGVAAILDQDPPGLVAGRIELFARRAKPTWVELWELTYGFPQRRFVEEQHFGATANVVTHRKVFERVGRFNSSLKSGGDREWGQRVHAAGLPVRYHPDVVVRHPARRTFREYAVKVQRVVGGMRDLDRDRAVMTPRMVPGHLAYITRKAWRRRKDHRSVARRRSDIWRLVAVEWWFEYVRMRERLRLRRGHASQR